MATPKNNGHQLRASRLYTTQIPPSLAEFKEICSQQIQRERYPLCAEFLCNVPIYNSQSLNISDKQVSEQLANEFHDILKSGSGVLVVRGMYQNEQLLRQINTVYESIIESERQLAKGDHFGKGGANDRIWNSFEKHGLRDAKTFFEYYSNPWLGLVSESWLGPGYRITSQVNVVKPGGQPQSAHRDYHLGFLDTDTCQRFPATTQIMSQFLTLQGAVAHSPMPTESGPTRLLPFSQLFDEGYMAYRLPEFSSFFADNYISLPLELGDGLFFNPALFHAAGENKTSSMHRIANLIQVSSAFGKPMEAVDSVALLNNSWPILQARYKEEGLSPAVMSFITAVAEGYPFPLNLDTHPPHSNGMAPDSEQVIVQRALKQEWTAQQLVAELNSLHA